MFFQLFAVGAAMAMFLGSLTLMEFGRRMGLRRSVEEGTTGMAGLNAVEGAVFALLGLLLAFSLSGALQRFDERRTLIMHEANAIGSAYAYLDLLDEPAKLDLRTKLKSYLQERLNLYKLPVPFSIAEDTSIYDADQQRKTAEIRM